MTRFARAKGSKASNLKTPEDSTPWEVMKEQLLKSKKDNEECKNREEAEKQRIENYNNFLKEHRTQKRKATWCEFPEAQTTKKSFTNIEQNDKDIQIKRQNSNNESISENNIQNTVNDKVKKNRKNKNNNLNNPEHNIDSSFIKENECKQDVENGKSNKCHVEDGIEIDQNIKKKKKNKKKLNNNFNSKEKNENNCKESPKVESLEIEKKTNENIPQTKQNLNQKKKKNKKQKQVNTVTETDASGNNLEEKSNQAEKIENTEKSESGKQKKKKNKNKKKLSEPNVNVDTDTSVITHQEKQSATSSTEPHSKKNKNKKDRRKPINDRSFQLIINAKEVQLIRFDGFPIMKKDAERLEELKKNMIKKGIPKSEVQRTMKLERRRAEKALARLRREVCYNCRKGGHNLSDCPDLKSNIPGAGTADGVCFKCGSTEHRQFECKVQQDKEFRFATCFICKESGHIARQCPDNPKGLYPNGGCCKLCGDVTHLRKDCPTVMDKKEGTSIKLQTLTDDNIEDIGQNIKPVPEETSKKPKKIKF